MVDGPASVRGAVVSSRVLLARSSLVLFLIVLICYILVIIDEMRRMRLNFPEVLLYARFAAEDVMLPSSGRAYIRLACRTYCMREMCTSVVGIPGMPNIRQHFGSQAKPLGSPGSETLNMRELILMPIEPLKVNKDVVESDGWKGF